MCLCCSPATKIRFSCVEANVYPYVCVCVCGGGGGGGKSYCFKRTAEWGKSKLGGVLLGQYMEIWFFNPLWSNGLSHTD